MNHPFGRVELVKKLLQIASSELPLKGSGGVLIMALKVKDTCFEFAERSKVIRLERLAG